jgi:hypothetical protein
MTRRDDRGRAREQFSERRIVRRRRRDPMMVVFGRLGH